MDPAQQVGLVIVLLGVLVVAVHGWCVHDGIYLDDHWHLRTLRLGGWNWQTLTESTEIEPAKFLTAWWQDQPLRWQYSRPLAMIFMKAAQDGSGQNLPLMHLQNLFWHWAAAVLTFLLARRLTGRVGWSALAGILFVIYPISVFVVSWIAALNVLMQTTFFLAAVLAYLYASGIKQVGTTGYRLQTAGGTSHALTDSLKSEASNLSSDSPVPSIHPGLFLAVLVFFVAGLFCRENMIVLPVITMSLDIVYGGWRWLRGRWWVHGLLWLVAAIFLYWRMTRFSGEIAEVYCRRPDGAADAGYLLWYLGKLVYYLVAVVWICPMFIGTQEAGNPWLYATGDMLLMTGVLLFWATLYIIACWRKVRGWWIWPLWITLAIWPAVPILPTPHTAYMAAAAWAIALVLKPATASAGQTRISRGVCWFFVGLSLFALVLYRQVWVAITSAEQWTLAQLSTMQPADPDEQLFFINQPLVNIYLPLSMEQPWNASPGSIHGQVLTFAPHLLMGPAATQIVQIDVHTFTVTLEENRYFKGLLGEFLLRTMHRGGELSQNETIPGEWFDTEIMSRDEVGVRKLKFTFHRPLAGSGFRFFLFTRDAPVCEIFFWAEGQHDFKQPVEIQICPVQLTPLMERYRARRERLFTLLRITRMILPTRMYMTQEGM
ncbi:MAG: hypothetical protein HJJLKODD_01678 [Phycisphaerae bacterium]|nr:hypothetical protein [Phycisphaerae bacterium]